MLISHISDIHLGYSQFNLQEREEDLYEVFEESIDKSIREHVKAVILSGDIFHNPKPHGAPIVRLARELKKLKEKSILVLFVLGEHDISRSNDVPLPYLFHNLGLARRLRPDSPVQIGSVLIYGFNKVRRSNMENGLIKPFKMLESIVKSDEQKYTHDNKSPSKILVLHQGLNDFNRFAGEISSNDLPSGFDYYAMGHYHDHIEKRFSCINDGLVAYPGSIDLGHSEPISNVEKGFLLVDITDSSEGVSTQWIKLDQRRPQLAYQFDYSNIAINLNSIIKETSIYSKKPVVDLQIVGSNIDQKILARQLISLESTTLYYNWSIAGAQISDMSGYSYDNDKGFDMDREMSALIQKSLGSKPLTDFSLDLIQSFNDNHETPYNDGLDKKKREQIAKFLWEFYETNRSSYENPQVNIKNMSSEESEEKQEGDVN